MKHKNYEFHYVNGFPRSHHIYAENLLRVMLKFIRTVTQYIVSILQLAFLTQIVYEVFHWTNIFFVKIQYNILLNLQ